MTSFNTSTVKALLVGAAVLGVGVYYQAISAQHASAADLALRQINAANNRAEAATETAKLYVDLVNRMADEKVDRQEPFSVVSEFSPNEIRQLGDVLDTLYQRDGHFFLHRFHLALREKNISRNTGAGVEMTLEGQKVLLFADETVSRSSLELVKR